MSIDIKEVTSDLPAEIETLAEQANAEGHGFVRLMIEEFKSSKNCFNEHGEFLLLAYDGEKLIACGGLNQQWNDQGIEERIGRVRRFYVLPEYRQHGVGKLLLQYLEKKAITNFSALCLNTKLKGAVSFYTKMNYVFVENHPNYNYFKYLI